MFTNDIVSFKQLYESSSKELLLKELIYMGREQIVSFKSPWE